MSIPAKYGSTQGWLPSIFNDFFNNEWVMRSGTTAPAINVFECENRYTVEVAAPGMSKEDFSIHLNSDNNLCICMEKNCGCKDGKCCTDKEHAKADTTNEERKGKYLRREFSYTKFQQTLILPENADTAKIEAKMSNGVLKIEIPKKQATEEQHTTRNIVIE
jgi:HSP20 family protein